jgi:hypothetical protein
MGLTRAPLPIWRCGRAGDIAGAGEIKVTTVQAAE